MVNNLQMSFSISIDNLLTAVLFGTQHRRQTVFDSTAQCCYIVLLPPGGTARSLFQGVRRVALSKTVSRIEALVGRKQAYPSN